MHATCDMPAAARAAAPEDGTRASAWKLALIDTLCEGGTGPGLSDPVGQAVRALGFDHYTYGLWLPLPLSNPCIQWIANTPLGWQRRYRRMHYLNDDPIVQHAHRCNEPLAWTDQVFAPHPKLQHDARAWGLRAGWSQACTNTAGWRGLFTLSRAAPLPAAELARQAGDLRWLASMAHLLLWHRAHRRACGAIKLTEREVEILRWTGDGKTSSDISEILAISHNTVNYHLKNAAVKLRAANKTSAVVLAVLLGLLRT